MNIIIDRQYCKGCGLCAAVCPAGAILPGVERNHMGYLMPLTNAPACTGCRNCEVTCPDLAVCINKDEAPHA